MERVEADKLSKRTSTKVWNVQEFCRRQNLCQKEEWRLTRLFGRFATASELLHNAKRAPRWRFEGSLPCKPGRLILRANSAAPVRRRSRSLGVSCSPGARNSGDTASLVVRLRATVRHSGSVPRLSHGLEMIAPDKARVYARHFLARAFCR